MNQVLNRILHPWPARRVTGETRNAERGTLNAAGASRCDGAKPTLLCVNGIYSASDGWESQAVAWGQANAPQLNWASYYYWSGVFLEGQTQHIAALAELMGELLGGKDERQKTKDEIVAGPVLDVIGHSNAANIILAALAANPALRVRNLTLLAAADYRSFKSGFMCNGLGDLLASGQVDRVILGVSAGDGVLGGPAQWLFPWWWGRTLGRDGPMDAVTIETSFAGLSDALSKSAVIVGRDDSLGHCDWVGSHMVETLETIVEATGGAA